MTGENPPTIQLPSEVMAYADDTCAAIADYLRSEGIIDSDHTLQSVSLKVQVGEPVQVTSYRTERSVVVPEE